MGKPLDLLRESPVKAASCQCCCGDGQPLFRYLCRLGQGSKQLVLGQNNDKTQAASCDDEWQSQRNKFQEYSLSRTNLKSHRNGAQTSVQPRHLESLLIMAQLWDDPLAAFSLDEIRCEIFVMDPEFSPAGVTEFLIIESVMQLSH
jgi:hypothetical protein